MPISNIPLSSPEPDDHISGQTSLETTSQEAAPAKRARRTKKQMIEDAVIPDNDAVIELKDVGTGAKIERPWVEAIQLVASEKASFVDVSLKYAVMKMAEQTTPQPAPAKPEQVQGEKRYVPGQASHMVKRGTFTDEAGIQNVRISDIFGGHEATMIKSEWEALSFDQPSDDPAERETRYTIDGKALLKTGSEGAAGGDRLIHYSDAHGGLGEMFEAEWELLSMSPPPSSGPVASSNIPPKAEIGDEVLVGAETMRIGHDRFLTSSSVAIDGEIIQPKRRWQREFGAGLSGKWESTVINVDGGVQPKREKKIADPTVPVEPVFDEAGKFDGLEPVAAEQNGHGDADKVASVNTEESIRAQGGEVDWAGDNSIKIGTGILEKIGIPTSDRFAPSSLQIGPVTLSRTVFDDGRREVVTLADGREGEVISAAVEGFELLNNTGEFIAGRFRGQLQAFLVATGTITQPVA